MPLLAELSPGAGPAGLTFLLPFPSESPASTLSCFHSLNYCMEGDSPAPLASGWGEGRWALCGEPGLPVRGAADSLSQHLEDLDGDSAPKQFKELKSPSRNTSHAGDKAWQPPAGNFVPS